ncbi:MAG: hypothetical protein AAF621_04375, partial [Pseudomonadota bacterium]
ITLSRRIPIGSNGPNGQKDLISSLNDALTKIQHLSAANSSEEFDKSSYTPYNQFRVVQTK